MPPPSSYEYASPFHAEINGFINTHAAYFFWLNPYIVISVKKGGFPVTLVDAFVPSE
jgi:hypothetical protein